MILRVCVCVFVFRLHSISLLQVMRSLLSDTAAVAKAARTHDARIEGLSRAIEMQHEALTKSCSVSAARHHSQ